MGQVIIIPFGYEDLPFHQRDRIVPICVPVLDPRGCEVPAVWFERGIAPVHEQLVAVAEHWLGDPWMVSELAESTVYKLFRRYGQDAGEYPWRRVLREAVWVAKDLHAGGSRAERIHRTAEVSFTELTDTLLDPIDYAELYEHKQFVDALKLALEGEGRLVLNEVLHLVRLGYAWDEIAGRFDFGSAEIFKRRFYRALQRHAKRLAHPPKNKPVTHVWRRLFFPTFRHGRRGF